VLLSSLLLTIWTGAALEPPPAAEPGLDRYRPWKLRSGMFLPYPIDNLFRGSFSCGRGRRHMALDLGGVGPEYGLGTPVRSIGPAEILAIGTPEADPKRYGERDTQAGETRRGRSALPRSGEVPGYGRVFFFTKDYGSGRTGVILTTRLLEGRRRGYQVRYLHLAAVRPDLAPGMRVAGGEEIGLLGGTAVMESGPHLHLAIRDARGKGADVGSVLGIGSTRLPCKRAAARLARQKYTVKARKLMARLVAAANRADPGAAARR
jgi:hypothetical protein